MNDVHYGAWPSEHDPLTADYRVTRAVDIISDRVLGGANPQEALRAIVRDGDPAHGLMGLSGLEARLHERAEMVNRPIDLPAAFAAVGDDLDAAVRAEHRVLFADPDDLARIEEAELAALPSTRAAAVRILAERQWRHRPAADGFAAARAKLRGRTIGVMLARLSEAIETSTPDVVRRTMEMIDAAHHQIAQHFRSGDSPDDIADFHRLYGDVLHTVHGGHPADVPALIDELAWRVSAEQRFLSALSDDERRDLGRRVTRAIGQVSGFTAAVTRLHRQIRAARPDIEYGGDPRFGESALHLFADAFDPIAELADTETLGRALSQDYPGASVDDIGDPLVARLLGRRHLAALQTVRRVGHALFTDGWLLRTGGRVELAPRALRHLGRTALRHALPGGRRPSAPAEAAPSTRRWTPGETAPVDLGRSVANAVLRTRAGGSSAGRLRVLPSDLEVIVTEEPVDVSTVLLIDASAEGRAAALAVDTLVRTHYPQDRLSIVLVDAQPRLVHGLELAELARDGSTEPADLPAALTFARRLLTRSPATESALVVACVLDPPNAEPLRRIARDGVHVHLAATPDAAARRRTPGLAADIVGYLVDLRSQLDQAV